MPVRIISASFRYIDVCPCAPFGSPARLRVRNVTSESDNAARRAGVRKEARSDQTAYPSPRQGLVGSPSLPPFGFNPDRRDSRPSRGCSPARPQEGSSERDRIATAHLVRWSRYSSERAKPDPAGECRERVICENRPGGQRHKEGRVRRPPGNDRTKTGRLAHLTWVESRPFLRFPPVACPGLPPATAGGGKRTSRSPLDAGSGGEGEGGPRMEDVLEREAKCQTPGERRWAGEEATDGWSREV